MLRQRLTVAILLVPFGVGLIYAGGWFFTAAVAAIMGYAAWEYAQLFRSGGYHPSVPVLVAGTAGLILSRHSHDLALAGAVLAGIVLAAMVVQVVQYERGNESASFDFNVTLGGVLYIGWLGSYFVALRGLPDGLWWMMLALPAAWLGDGAAYFVGSHFGRHKMAPRVSPKKTWEGYIGGVLFGSLLTMALAAVWALRAPDVTLLKGLVMGLAVTVITPLGDLGESMLKRGFGLKDSGNVLPGHGGILDRVDSWLWAVVIGYYLVLLAF